MELESIKAYIKENEPLLLKTLRELCAIPAPSGKEEKRAAYCKQWLDNIGAEGVYIDEALNVIFPVNCDGSDKITVFVAHTDTVFPDMEPMPYVDDGEKIHCPGVGDDTACVAVLLLLAKYYVENNIKPAGGFLFVCNSCEEGLGNLKGTRQLFQDYAGRIARFISFDSNLDSMYDNCAGSHRYEVEVQTPGGHSFSRFGIPNAIAHLAKIISKIYAIQVPAKEGCRTTYNVGTVTGGTSVNTIAQSAKMLCEYRSEDKDCLAYMEKQFAEIFAQANTDEVKVIVNKVGDRPCSDIQHSKVAALVERLRPIISDVIQMPITIKSASTDCNIPLSMGIPAVCMGAFFGGGSHTREEWVRKDSLTLGLEAVIRVANELCTNPMAQ